MQYEEAFVTGCDYSCEWMLAWWIKNYKQHNSKPIIFANFGVTDLMLSIVRENFDAVMDLSKAEERGWFKKPKAMLHSPAKKTVWIDTDCEILTDIGDIFDLLEPDKLNMVEDKPWSKRRGEDWHNSGVVGFIDKPHILKMWCQAIKDNPIIGDQETLHTILSPITKLKYINELPNVYNWLRVQMENDQEDTQFKKIIHWTGYKGKQRIRTKING